MGQHTSSPVQDSGKYLAKDGHIHFSMNMPDWYRNLPVKEQCNVVKTLVEELKDEKPISHAEEAELFSLGDS